MDTVPQEKVRDCYSAVFNQKKFFFFDVVKKKMIVILRHTIMNQWSWLQVFMMFQKISMLSFFIIMLTLHSLIFCASW